MKKNKFLLIFLITLFAFNLNAFAASGSLSVSSESIYIGDEFTVTVNVNSAAAWNVHVSASGPVSSCTINQANVTEYALDTNKAFSTTCTATKEGIINIVLSGDVTSSTDGIAVGISDSKNVTVKIKSTPPSNNNNNQLNQNNTNNKSENNNIKELAVDGYELIKVNTNNYTLSVPYDVTSININAIAEDEKAKISGIGNYNISIGENNIEVIVVAENGLQNKINIKVNRKDGYYLEDLDSLLNNNQIEDISITIKNDTVISSQDLEKIKNSKKIVKFNYYDENKILLYSWIIDGLKVKSNNILTTVSFETEYKKEILKLSNYADGLFINLKNSDKLPEGIILRVYIGNKYTNEDKVNIYYYDNNQLKLLYDEIDVKEEYVEFNVNNALDYFITMSKISDATGIEKKSNKSYNTFIIIVITLIILDIGVYFFIKKKNSKIR